MPETIEIEGGSDRSRRFTWQAIMDGYSHDARASVCWIALQISDALARDFVVKDALVARNALEA